MTIREALGRLFERGCVEIVGDRPLAVAVFRAALDSRLTNVGGSASRDEVDGTAIFLVTADPPLCDGGCGEPTNSPTGMCYRCQCEAHAEGWYSMDVGRVRNGRTDADVHAELDRAARYDAVAGF